MANYQNNSDQVVPVVDNDEVVVSYVSPNLMPDTPDTDLVSLLNIYNI